MKANEVPEKIWLGKYTQSLMLSNPNSNTYVEYVHKDAFIEKACEWIREFNNHHYIMRYSDSCEPPISELTEWFKNYMKEGGKDE